MLDPNSVFRIWIKPQLNLSLWVKSLCPIRQLHHTTLSLGVPEAPPLYHVYHSLGQIICSHGFPYYHYADDTQFFLSIYADDAQLLCDNLIPF